MKTKFYHTDLTGLPLLNSFLVLKGTETSVVPMLPSGGGEEVGGSETIIIITRMLKHEKVDLIKKKIVFSVRKVQILLSDLDS